MDIIDKCIFTKLPRELQGPGFPAPFGTESGDSTYAVANQDGKSLTLEQINRIIKKLRNSLSIHVRIAVRHTRVEFLKPPSADFNIEAVEPAVSQTFDLYVKLGEAEEAGLTSVMQLEIIWAEPATQNLGSTAGE